VRILECPKNPAKLLWVSPLGLHADVNSKRDKRAATVVSATCSDILATIKRVVKRKQQALTSTCLDVVEHLGDRMPRQMTQSGANIW
jgi:hypothetical protein